MEFEKVFENRDARNSRNARPYANFREAADQCLAAGRDLCEGNAAIGYHRLLERSVIIAFVSHVEVYFRDMLDSIFKQCDPDFFLPVIRHIHQSKYTIDDLISIHSLGINPLELVSSDISFQSVDNIDKVFSKFLNKSLWGEAINLKIRTKDRPEQVVTFEPEYLDSLKRIFRIRHRIVHNPLDESHITKAVLGDISNADGLILAADIVLCNMLAQNRDPGLMVESGRDVEN